MEVRKIEWTILTSTSGFLVTKILSSRYWVKSPCSQTTKSHQIVKSSLREGTNLVNSIQVKFVQAWTNNNCINKEKKVKRLKVRKYIKRNEIKWKGNIPSGRRRPRGLAKGGKGALPSSTGSPIQFPEIIKNSVFQRMSDELRPFIKLQ